jgi:hypothetical protein
MNLQCFAFTCSVGQRISDGALDDSEKPAQTSELGCRRSGDGIKRLDLRGNFQSRTILENEIISLGNFGNGQHCEEELESNSQ